MKVAPLIRLLQSESWARVRVLATAQHRELLDQIFEFFGIEADIDLNIMQPDQSLAELSSRLLTGIDEVLAREKPDIVLAQGDTTTVMMMALSCFYGRIPFGHIEAGLRTYRKYSPFPEEMNRVVAGHLGDLHFAPTDQARRNLLREGIAEDRIFVTGNTVIDALLWTAEQPLPEPFDVKEGRRLILVTAHRRENFGRPLEEICSALCDLVEARDVEVIYPVHPNPNVVSVVEDRLRGQPGIRLMPPLNYAEFVAAMKASYLILTDSGGVQEEAPSLGKPVLVLRDETERPEGVAAGTACVVGPHREAIVEKALELLDDPQAYDAMARACNPYGDGSASRRIADGVRAFLEKGAGGA